MIEVCKANQSAIQEALYDLVCRVLEMDDKVSAFDAFEDLYIINKVLKDHEVL